MECCKYQIKEVRIAKCNLARALACWTRVHMLRRTNPSRIGTFIACNFRYDRFLLLFLGVPYALVKARNTLWTRPCLSVPSFGRSLGIRKPQGLPQGSKWTEWVALQGFPLSGASTPGVPQRAFPPKAVAPLGLLHVGLHPQGLLPVALPPTRALPSLGWKPLGFYHLRVNHQGLGSSGNFATDLATSGDCAP
jgi:hypothetical protein